MSGSALGAMKFMPVSVEGLHWRGGNGALRPPRARSPQGPLGGVPADSGRDRQEALRATGKERAPPPSAFGIDPQGPKRIYAPP